jgi:hypothetical protein
MATKEDLLALVTAQAPSLSDEKKAEVTDVAYVLSFTHPDTNANLVARALGIVPNPPAPPAAPAPLTFDQEVAALLDGNVPALSNEEKTTALAVVAKAKANNPNGSAEACVRYALRKILT